MSSGIRPDMGVRLFHGKPLMEKSAYLRRIAMLWAFALIWVCVFLWVLTSYSTNPVWLTALLAAALFLLSPEIGLLTRSYDAYRRGWERDNHDDNSPPNGDSAP